jgi:hypothetical protein
VHKKSLSVRAHVLPDGRVIKRDQAAAWVLWNIGQQVLGQELPGSHPKPSPEPRKRLDG